MIFCKFSELRRYESALPHLDAALECAEQVCAQERREGRHAFEGGYLFVQTGRTAPISEGRYEIHHRYADVQVLLRGEEDAAYLPVSALVPDTEYDAERDIQFFRGAGPEPTVLRVPAGMCYAVFPEDGHMPCRCVNEPRDFEKIVIKLCLDAPADESNG